MASVRKNQQQRDVKMILHIIFWAGNQQQNFVYLSIEVSMEIRTLYQGH